VNPFNPQDIHTGPRKDAEHDTHRKHVMEMAYYKVSVVEVDIKYGI
jgi:hypothetical protein